MFGFVSNKNYKKKTVSKLETVFFRIHYSIDHSVSELSPVFVGTSSV